MSIALGWIMSVESRWREEGDQELDDVMKKKSESAKTVASICRARGKLLRDHNKQQQDQSTPSEAAAARFRLRLHH